MFQRVIAQAMGDFQAKNQDAMKLELGMADKLGPEGMKQQVGLGSMPDRMAMNRDVMGMEGQGLQDQMSRAQALQSQRFGNSGSATGNALGGIGDVLNSLRGGIMEQRAHGGMDELMKRYRGEQGGMFDKQDAGRGALMNARFGAMRDLFGGGQPSAAPYYLAKP